MGHQWLIILLGAGSAILFAMLFYAYVIISMTHGSR